MLLKVASDWLHRTNKLERTWLLAKIEFKLRYYENKLGLFWALLKPVMDIVIYYIAFKIILKSDIPAFASYLFIGLIFWIFFTEGCGGSIQILQTKKYLYEYSNMNKLEIYISTLLSNSIGFFFNTTMFFLFYLFLEPESKPIGINAFYLLPLFFNLFLLSLGIALILSNVYVIAKDITQIWQVFINFLFFLSPIFYKLTVYRQSLPGLDYLNPVAGLIINARRTILENQPPEWQLFYFDFGYAILFFLIGIILLNRLGSKAAEKL
ncbi:MAG: ABC transporter permease [Bacteroidetes bacterium]|nr:ABC transporter permease [Bacteroidota bacterium]MBS1736026.1 ABC transporter permease [Bacteroidota bacterium]MBS1744600.1 ABC transporter permease [Bacteroidota bacterium]